MLALERCRRRPGHDADVYVGDDAVVNITGQLKATATTTAISSPSISSVSVSAIRHRLAQRRGQRSAPTPARGSATAPRSRRPRSTLDARAGDPADLTKIGHDATVLDRLERLRRRAAHHPARRERPRTRARCSCASARPAPAARRTAPTITATGAGGISADSFLHSVIRAEPNFEAFSLFGAGGRAKSIAHGERRSPHASAAGPTRRRPRVTSTSRRRWSVGPRPTAPASPAAVGVAIAHLLRRRRPRPDGDDDRRGRRDASRAAAPARSSRCSRATTTAPPRRSPRRARSRRRRTRRSAPSGPASTPTSTPRRRPTSSTTVSSGASFSTNGANITVGRVSTPTRRWRRSSRRPARRRHRRRRTSPPTRAAHDQHHVPGLRRYRAARRRGVARRLRDRVRHRRLPSMKSASAAAPSRSARGDAFATTSPDLTVNFGTSSTSTVNGSAVDSPSSATRCPTPTPAPTAPAAARDRSGFDVDGHDRHRTSRSTVEDTNR